MTELGGGGYIDFVIAQQIRIPRSVRIGLSAGRTDGRTTGLLFCQLAGCWREGGLLQQKWGPPPRQRRSGVWSGREEKEKKCADKREGGEPGRRKEETRERRDSVGRKRPIDKVSEQVVPRDKRRRGHYCLSNCGRVPLGPRERARAV